MITNMLGDLSDHVYAAARLPFGMLADGVLFVCDNGLFQKVDSFTAKRRSFAKLYAFDPLYVVTVEWAVEQGTDMSTLETK